MIYNKYIFGFNVSGTELLQPLEFLSDENEELVFSNVDEVTWNSPKDGGWLSREPTM